MVRAAPGDGACSAWLGLVRARVGRRCVLRADHVHRICTASSICTAYKGTAHTVQVLLKAVYAWCMHMHGICRCCSRRGTRPSTTPSPYTDRGPTARLRRAVRSLSTCSPTVRACAMHMHVHGTCTCTCMTLLLVERQTLRIAQHRVLTRHALVHGGFADAGPTRCEQGADARRQVPPCVVRHDAARHVDTAGRGRVRQSNRSYFIKWLIK